MKKAVLLLLTICMAFISAVPVFADGRGPAFTEFKVVCTKDTPYYEKNWEKDGVMEKKGTFTKGTTLEVEYEYEKDDILYGSVEIGYGEDKDWVYIRLSDVSLKDENYLPENDQKLSKPQTVRVIGKGGVPMYAGPNKKYKKVLMIPRGTKLTYNYGNDESGYYRTWAYVTYLNKSGWIYVYALDTKNGLAELPEEGENAEIWVLKDNVKLYNGISFGNIEDNFKDWDKEYLAELHEEPDRVNGTLEKDKKYTYRYKHDVEYGTTWYYVMAGLRAGWVYQDNVGNIAVPTSSNDKNRYLTYKPLKLKLHKIPDEKSGAVTVNLGKGEYLNPEYATYNDNGYYYYETIHGQSGWYYNDSVVDDSAYKIYRGETSGEYTYKNENEQAAPIYTDILEKDKTVGEIPSNAIFTPLYEGSYETVIDEDNDEYEYTWFYYVRYGDLTGWVDESDLEKADVEEEDYDNWINDDWIFDEEFDDDSDEPEEKEESDYEEDYEDYDDEIYDYEDVETDTEAERSLSPLQIVIICVVVAIILSLTAAVTLILIYRRRNSDRKKSSNETIWGNEKTIEAETETKKIRNANNTESDPEDEG